MKSKLLFLFTALLLFMLSGCESISYYGQAISGQFYIVSHRKKIASLLADASTPEQLKVRLQSVNSLRAYAATALQLPAGDQFISYVDVKRPYVIWNVFAAEEFSVKPLAWCYPVAGCVPYRGYFSEEAAVDKAAKLRVKGYDTYVGGVTAYSTLGWFSDPVLNTVLGRESWQLAALLFHELAHQVVYVKGDAQFNESFATTVEQEGLRRWISDNFDASESTTLLAAINTQLQQQEQFVALVQSAVSDLAELYQSGKTRPTLRVEKQERLERLRAAYQQQKLAWGGYGGYDAWFGQELNNAQLSTVATYNTLVPAFTRILESCASVLPCLYAEAARLATLPAVQRQKALDALMQENAGSVTGR